MTTFLWVYNPKLPSILNPKFRSAFMDFFDEESRPRFLLQSRSTSKSNPQSETLDQIHKPTLFVSLSLSALLLTLSLFYFQSDPLKSIFIWFSLSLLIGPFAPNSFTAGDIRVGLGPTLQPQSPPRHSHEPEQPKRSRFKSRKHLDQDYNSIPNLNETLDNNSKNDYNKNDYSENGNVGNVIVLEEQDWTESDFELLKRQLVKNPVGMPGRWDAVAEAFSGRHKVESVVKMAKSMGERKMGDSDSFSRFLKDRKAVDKRVDEVIENERFDNTNNNNVSSNGGSWSSSEDIALLNALKAFPKDVPLRWEKITAAVPGRSKAACMKRVADLKKDFRSSKA